MAGSALKELENDKGIIIRYVIGRSSNRGDMLDRQIDQESKETNDFLILVLNWHNWSRFMSTYIYMDYPPRYISHVSLFGMYT